MTSVFRVMTSITTASMMVRFCSALKASRSPAGLLSVIALLITVSAPSHEAQAQVELESDRGIFSVKNLSSVNLLDVTRGQSSVGVLLSGDTWRSEEIPSVDLFGDKLPLTLDGRIDLAQWGDAMNQRSDSPLWARLHLTTAGFDVHRGSLMSSLLGSVHKQRAIKALRDWTPAESDLELRNASPLKLGLLAYAARYSSSLELLKALLTHTRPPQRAQGSQESDASQQAQWPEAYKQLPRPLSSLREAIELKGVSALPMVLRDPVWAHDRGFSRVELAFAILPEIEVINALKDRGDLQLAVRFLKEAASDREYVKANSALGARVALSHLKKLIALRREGDQKGALSAAISTVLMWRRNRISPRPSQTTRILCGYLTTNAQRASNQKQLLAAQALLNLSKDVCFGGVVYRESVAELMRVRGDISSFEFNLDDALQWYRASTWANQDLIDRVRLIDTLSRVAVREMAQGDIKGAQAYLKEARALETPQMPVRESLVVATRLMPTPDRRAQVGMLVLIVILAVGALSQILRVLFGRKR